MEAEKKLQGAFYHLQKMGELYLKNEEQFTHEFEAFLTKVRSVPDVMLEDFNKKFNLGISLKEDLYPDTFEKKAKQLKNKEATSFIEWWKNKMGHIRSSYTGPLFDKRNIAIHRKTVPPDLKKVNLVAKISAFAEITVHDAKGNVVAKSSSIRPKDKEPQPPKVEWSFTDYPNDNALDVSKKLLDEVHKMLEEAKTQFEK